MSSPAAAPRFLHWLFSLGCEPDAAAKLILRFPNVLKLDLESAIKPRYEALLGTGVPPAKLLQGLVRGPTILGVEPEALLARISYLREVGLSQEEIGNLIPQAPLTLLTSVEHKLVPLVGYLRDELGAPRELILGILARGRLATISAAALRERVEGWGELGFSQEDIRDMLRKYSNFLRVPPRSRRVRAKLAFLEDGDEGLGLPRAALVAHPQYLSYSLMRRVGPRADASLRFGARRIRLGDLGSSDAGFCARLGITVEHLGALADAWQRSPVG